MLLEIKEDKLSVRRGDFEAVQFGSQVNMIVCHHAYYKNIQKDETHGRIRTSPVLSELSVT